MVTADDGSAAVAVTLSGAVQPDASGGVGDPLANLNAAVDHVVAAYAKATADAVASDPHWVTLDLNDPALPTRLGDWKFRSEHLGFTADYCTRYLAAHPEDRARYRLWGVSLLEFMAELGRAT